MSRATHGGASAVAYVEVGPGGACCFGLEGQPTLTSLAPLAARARQAAHDLEASAVRQHLGVGGELETVDVVTGPLAVHGGVVLPLGAPMNRARSTAPERSAAAFVIPFRRRAARSVHGTPATSAADAVRVEMTFSGHWPVQLSVRADGALDARTKLRAVDALRALARSLADHQARSLAANRKI